MCARGDNIADEPLAMQHYSLHIFIQALFPGRVSCAN